MKKLGLVFCLVLVICCSNTFGQSELTKIERILNNSIQTTLDPCPVGPATNPTPANGTTNISISSPGSLTWNNGDGTTLVDVYFGPDGNAVWIYSGSAISSLLLPPPLNYQTTYEWKVVCKNDTCNAESEIWSFTTEADPSIIWWEDNFEEGLTNWTITNDGGTCIWQIFEPPYPNLYTLPNSSYGGVLVADADFCGMGTTLLSTATITNPIVLLPDPYHWIEFDNDWQAFDSTSFGYVEISTDNINWQMIRTFHEIDVRYTHEFINISSFVGIQAEVYVRFRSVQPGWHWWWAIDNLRIGYASIPVELTSFTSSLYENDVTLNWQTATETNNQGFQIERRKTQYERNEDWNNSGFVNGNGTTTEPQSYSFVDKNLEAGKYQYRLKQIDFDGTFEYSNVIEVEIVPPLKFSLEQNYPNPFNPVTSIQYSINSMQFVTLKVYDVLGKEVATLVNEEKPSGHYEINFNASNLASGIYYYQLRAGEFVETKKMLLLK